MQPDRDGYDDEDQARYDNRGNKGVILGEFSMRELVILYHHGSFSEAGDSGSFVIDVQGNVAGLLYG